MIQPAACISNISIENTMKQDTLRKTSVAFLTLIIYWFMKHYRTWLT